MLPLQAELMAAEYRRDRERHAQQRALVSMARAQNGLVKAELRFWPWRVLQFRLRRQSAIDVRCSCVEICG